MEEKSFALLPIRENKFERCERYLPVRRQYFKHVMVHELSILSYYGLCKNYELVETSSNCGKFDYFKHAIISLTSYNINFLAESKNLKKC